MLYFRSYFFRHPNFDFQNVFSTLFLDQVAFLKGKWHPKRKNARIDRKRKRVAGLVKNRTGPRTPKRQRKHKVAKRERDEAARLKREEGQVEARTGSKSTCGRKAASARSGVSALASQTPPVSVIHRTEEEKQQLERLLDLRKWMAECHAYRTYNIIAKQPIIPPCNTLLDGPDPSAPRHCVLREITGCCVKEWS